MSATSSISPTSPTSHRDIRSATQPFKRDKDRGSKWSNGQRPSAGVRINNYPSLTSTDELVGGSDSQKEKVRPRKQASQCGKWTDTKSHANKIKPGCSTYDMGRSGSRIAHKIDASIESNDSTPLSKSLIELLPSHINNTNTQIQTAIREDSEILYSFDNKGPSPGEKGRKVELGGLIDKAEKKWVAEQTEKMIRGEYEVLDGEGETVKVGKGKRSPKRKVGDVTVKGLDGEEDDGFQLV